MSPRSHSESPGPLVALFADQAGAERAAAAARAAAPDVAVEIADLGADDAERSRLARGFAAFFAPRPDDGAPAEGPVRLIAAAASADGRARAAEALRAAGGRLIEAGPDAYPAPRAAAEPGPPPRRVQPGFADARPGFVPDPAPSPEPDPATDQPRGRFAEQLDRLPETDGRRR
jgi:hypothetical protein